MLSPIKKFFLFLSCAFLWACTPAEWPSYTVADGAITLSLPQAPQTEQQTLELVGRSVKFESQVLHQGEQVYRLNYYPLSSEDDAEQILQALLLYTQKILQLPEETKLQKVHDYQLSNTLSQAGKNNSVKVRIVLNQKFLIFSYAFTNQESQAADADKFLQSLVLK